MEFLLQMPVSDADKFYTGSISYLCECTRRATRGKKKVSHRIWERRDLSFQLKDAHIQPVREAVSYRGLFTAG